MSKLDDIHFGGEVKKFFNLPVFGRSRKTDPTTSHEAAEQLSSASNHFQMIQQALVEHGDMGKDEIAFWTNLDSNAVARRLPELQKLGIVTLTGKTVLSNSGRKEREWTVKRNS